MTKVERQRIYRKRHYLKNKQKVKDEAVKARKNLYSEINNFKTFKGCYLCGERDCWCLEFHHVNDDKHDNISKILQYCNRQKLYDEVAKCIVLCTNCHRKIHALKHLLKKKK